MPCNETTTSHSQCTEPKSLTRWIWCKYVIDSSGEDDTGSGNRLLGKRLVVGMEDDMEEMRKSSRQELFQRMSSRNKVIDMYFQCRMNWIVLRPWCKVCVCCTVQCNESGKVKCEMKQDITVARHTKNDPWLLQGKAWTHQRHHSRRAASTTPHCSCKERRGWKRQFYTNFKVFSSYF